jgi:hypothetical protein
MSAPRHRHRRLPVRTARDGDRTLVEIGDNGPGRHPLPGAAAPHPERVTPGPGLRPARAQVPPWAATAQITKMSRVMMSSDQNG